MLKILKNPYYELIPLLICFGDSGLMFCRNRRFSARHRDLALLVFPSPFLCERSNKLVGG